MEGEEATDNHRNVAGFKVGTKLSSKRSTVLKSQCSSKKVNRSKKIR